MKKTETRSAGNRSVARICTCLTSHAYIPVFVLSVQQECLVQHLAMVGRSYLDKVRDMSVCDTALLPYPVYRVVYALLV